MTPARPAARRTAVVRSGWPLALVTAAVVAIWFGTAARDEPELSSVASEVEPPAASIDERPPPLAASGRVPPLRETEHVAATEAVADAGPARAPVATTATVADFFALAPGTVDDRISPGALAPFPIPRSDIVGKVLPFGVRDAAAAGSPRFIGVARIELDAPARPSPTKEVEAPATTALRGVVVGEDGDPIRGAEVLVYSSFYVRQARYDHRAQQIGRALTDAEGVFDLRPISLDTVHFGADGDVLVTVRHPVLADLVAQSLPAIVPGRETDVGRLVLPGRAGSIHGVIRDLEGRPVAGAVVRVSGAFDPTAYDKTERMIVLDACPAAVTDAEGRYALGDFATGVHELSIHVHIDCVLHVSERFEGDREWSPRVLAGNAVRGRVVDPDGESVGAAVVVGGGNWTPTNLDGTFWLDNVRKGPLTLEVVHHDWHKLSVTSVATNADDITVRLARRLPRVTMTVLDLEGAVAPLVAIDWAWPPGGGPGPFSTESRYWHDARGVFALIVPEGAVSATISDAKGSTRSLGAEDLVDGVRRAVTLAAKALSK